MKLEDNPQGLSAYELIQRAKVKYMQKQSKTMDWKETENNMVTSWYFVSKIMSHLVPRTFPWFTFNGLVEEIRNDPNYKKKEEG